ncbi:hypothetical protein DPMN_079715 [Dreissena polymorpha]|uniref:CDK5 regulatory subunit-associated protein 3 n=1 Tax=Dreissena polymorpha TaxID=45954 RepID=A0A9D4BRE8_DREPO|nr:hypothetical protein DPMN_079715 [Dreissena polymorpha]
MQDVEHLPIDIHYNKLLDWLVNRRHCKQQWQAASLIVQEKITAAVQGLPDSKEIKGLVARTDLNYFHCQQVIELLKDTSCGEKNIFGQYSSVEMKAWSDIIKIYERDGMFLAETAQMLIRNVSYEIPALKKQIARCQQVQKECDKKEADYVSKASELRKKYAASCKELGIKGDKIKSELAALVKDLPKSTHRFLSLPYGQLGYSPNNTQDEEDAKETGDGAAGAEIDFDISGITLESGGTDEGKGVATGEEAMTMLDNVRMRNLFLDDLMEVALVSDQ